MGTIRTSQSSVSSRLQPTDSPLIDPFARLRVSNPLTLFDSKQIFDNQPLIWDDAEISGSGTGTAYSNDEAATTISVGNLTAGKRVRQTFQRFNYQPGKGQQILMTFSEFDTSTGITKSVGSFDDDNGLFFESSEGVLSVVRRSSVTGSAVDDRITQSNWNLDKLDGTGASGITLDPSKAQIGFIDYEWLGVGRVRMGFVIDGLVYYCHQFLATNNLTTVYMSTPNLPCRYEIENDGTGSADDFVHICSSVQSEGGQSANGILRYKSTGGTDVDANVTGTVYAVVGVRLKGANIACTLNLVQISMIVRTNDDFEWIALLNPTVAGSPTWSNETDSCVQTFTGATANTVTGGIELIGGYAQSNVSLISSIPSSRGLGAALDGTVDEFVLCVRPLSGNANVYGGVTWRELS